MGLLGLCGSQRSGKSTLAKAYAEKHGVFFLETSASAVFRDMGLDPAVTYDFETRLAVQKEILARFNLAYAGAPLDAITDRTPIDLMAYTLSECLNDNVTPALETEVEHYVQACFDSLNRYFSAVVLVQPGIPLVPAPGKASLSRAHIEHISALCLGLTVDARLKIGHFYIHRHHLSIEERLQALESVGRRTVKDAVQGKAEYLTAGGMLQ